ncbi:threonyl-tRNA synthetase [Erysipelotrichaceae bacterium]|nr:threonyl-tRNA synthetase [Erysipelotrichaceae bacterium]
MNKIEITFPDGNMQEFDINSTIYDIAGTISSGLKKKAVAGIVNGLLFDLNRVITENAVIQIITDTEKDAVKVLNHSAAHLLAQAVKRLFPDAQFGVGPAIAEGFYYDIDSGDTKITEADLKKIEKEMKRISSQNMEMIRTIVTPAEALKLFENDVYKTELIHEIAENEEITVYTQGEFTDLCVGGHIGYTGKIKNFTLLSIAGAYWRGDSKRAQLQRIYGYAAFSEKEVKAYLEILIERKERDHRKIGKEMELFTFTQLTGQGLPLWLPNGFKIRKVIEDYIIDQEVRRGYEHVLTPVVGNVDLYRTSGHWDHYREDMFPMMEIDGEQLVLRPMSCPHHMMVYKNNLHSYRDLPIRIAENVVQYRYESSGSLTGLERVRAMTLTDSHIFVRPDQIKAEFKEIVAFIQDVHKTFDVEVDYYRLSYRDPADKEKYYDNAEMWDNAEKMLKETMDELQIPYVEAIGEAAFYGPKLDIQVKSAIGHEITLSTVQLDFLLPERFELSYIGDDGQKHRPVVIHRGLIGTYDRFVAYLIERYKGAFPLWLAPEQIRIIPVSLDAHFEYAKTVEKLLLHEGYRVKLDAKEEKLGYKIREAQTSKVPYTLILGDAEIEEQKLSFRKYGEQATTTVPQSEFLTILETRKNDKK